MNKIRKFELRTKLSTANQKLFFKLFNLANKNDTTKKYVKLITLTTPNLFFTIYFTGFAYIFFNNANYNNTDILKYILIPLCTIIFSKIIRKNIFSKRPFEKFDIQSLVHHRGGNSMPSNHSASAFAIAISVINIANITHISAILIILAIITAISRVMAGVHFPLDVLAGAILAMIIGFIGFFVI